MLSVLEARNQESKGPVESRTQDHLQDPSCLFQPLAPGAPWLMAAERPPPLLSTRGFLFLLQVSVICVSYKDTDWAYRSPK